MGKKTRIVLTSSLELSEARPQPTQSERPSEPSAANSETATDKGENIVHNRSLLGAEGAGVSGNIGHPRDAAFTPENIGHPRDAAFTPENIGHPRDAAFTPENIGHPRDAAFTPENIGHPRSNPGPSGLELAEVRVVRRISVSRDGEGNIFLDLEE